VVALRVLDVDEDRVVLGRPAPARLGTVVVGPYDLVEEAVAAEEAVEVDLDVMALARVEMDVERPVIGEQPAGVAQARRQEADVVLEGVLVGQRADLLRAIAAPREPGAVAARGGRRRRRCSRPVLNGGSM